VSESLTPLPSTIPTGSIVDAYLRDSGGEKQDRSVSRQLESIKAYAARHGLQLRHIYKDEAKSGGSTAERDAFDRLIASTRNEEDRPVAILLWNYARFARDLDDSTYYKALLRKRGIIVHSLTDPIPEGPYARFVEILIDISNEEKRRQTAIDTRDGLRSIVMQGAVPGVPPRGFKREPMHTVNPRTGEQRKNHRWVPDPKYTHRIQKAFQMRAERASLNEIQKATKLFSTINSYATLWTNKLFIGTLEYGGMTIENYCEPIITKALWDKVQLVQQEFKQSANVKDGSANHPRRQASDFILSGLARCSRCGSPLYGRTSHQKSGSKYQSYLCTLAYRKRGACSKGRIPRPAFEAAVIKKLAEEIYTEENIQDLIRLQNERIAGSASEQADQRRELLSRLASVKKKLSNITEAIAENGSSAALLTSLNTLEREQQDINLQLIEIENNTDQPIRILTPEQIRSQIKRIHDILKGKDDHAKKILLRGLVAWVEVERVGKFLIGKVAIYTPEDNDGNITPSEDDPSPPDDELPDKPPRHKNVPLPHSPSGPQRVTLRKETPVSDEDLFIGAGVSCFSYSPAPGRFYDSRKNTNRRRNNPQCGIPHRRTSCEAGTGQHQIRVSLDRSKKDPSHQVWKANLSHSHTKSHRVPQICWIRGSYQSTQTQVVLCKKTRNYHQWFS
jgi:DNA invertase Pin-like site-specific DNA recombinase